MPAKLFADAIAQHRAGQLDEAEKIYTTLLKMVPGHAGALRLMGGLCLQKNHWQEAVEWLGKAVIHLPKDAETLTNYALALHRAGRREDAAVAFKRALAEQPDYIPALANYGSLCQESGHYDEALEMAGRVLNLNPQNPVAHYNYGNILLACGRSMEAATRYEHALRLKPDYLEAMVNLGMALARAGDADRSGPWLAASREWFEKALAARPDDPVILNNYANILRQEGEAAQALDHYRKALQVKPDYADAAINMATALRDLGLYAEAVASCLQALALEPGSANARINLGVSYQELGEHEKAVAVFAEALKLKPDSLDARWNKALSLMALGQYEEGWSLHEAGLGVEHMRGAYPSPAKRWDGKPFPGKRLMIWAEQGLGDSLQFIRYAALCKKISGGGKVVVLCPPSLRGLFSHCPFIDELPAQATEADYDFHVPMMSLPHTFGTTLDSVPAEVPYLFAGSSARAKWAGKIGGSGLKVGLVWAGNAREHQLGAHLIDRRRSMKLETLRPLFALPGVTFVNLQMGAPAAQIEVCGLRGRFVDPMPEVKDFEDTAAIVAQLDLVISVDTSVVHLAGGMGKPVWVLSRFDACWRWLQNRPDNPWYPTARVFGQRKPGDWDSVIAEVAQALKTRISG